MVEAVVGDAVANRGGFGPFFPEDDGCIAAAVEYGPYGDAYGE